MVAVQLDHTIATRGLVGKIDSKALGPLPKLTIYYGTVVHTPDLSTLEAFPSCAVLVDGEGTIQDIDYHCLDLDGFIYKHKSSLNGSETSETANGPIGPLSAQLQIIDISDNPCQFFFPGFIDTHIHAPQFPNAGIFGNSTLLDWLETYTFPLEASFGDLGKAHKIYSRVVQQTLHNGTTTASYFATIHAKATKLLANICFQKGQRALIGRVCMDDNSPDFYSETHEEMKANTLDVCGHIDTLTEIQKTKAGESAPSPSKVETQEVVLAKKARLDKEVPLIYPILTPRFAPSCTSETLQWLGDLRKEQDLHVQSHVSENIDEIKLVHKLFPNSSCYTGVYNDFNLLSQKTVLAHGVHLTNEEIEILKSTLAGISHCPISNSSLTSGEAHVHNLLNAGVKVGLGTDMSGGFSPSILSTARQAHLVSRHVAMKSHCDNDKLSVTNVLYLATKGGAECLALDPIVGDFQVGKKWEAQLVDLRSEESQIDVFDWQLPEYLIKRNKYYEKVLRKHESLDKVSDTGRVYVLPDNKSLLEASNFFGLEPSGFKTKYYGFDITKFTSEKKEKGWLKEDGSFTEEDKLKFDNLVAKWLFNGDDRNTVKVFVNGRCVVSKN